MTQKIKRYSLKIKDSGTVKDNNYARYTLKTGARADAFKQYLRDRGIKFEPSENGEYTEFVVFKNEDAIDRRVEDIIKTIRDNNYFKEEQLRKVNNVNDSNRINIKDMNAEEIIALFREAGEKQRSWYWLQNKLPEEFLELTGKGHAQLFPVKQYRKEYDPRGVNLTKPKSYVETLNWDWIPEYEKLKLELDDILRKNDVYDFRNLSLKLRNMIKEEDSISRRNILEIELKEAKELEYEINRLINRNISVLPRRYRLGQFTELDFNFDKKDFINAFKGSYEEREYARRQKTPIVGGANSQYIYTNDDKVGMITPEAEDYIRRIMKEATTSGITNKREERFQNRKNKNWEQDGYKDDVINLWRRDRRELSLLLKEFKQIAYEGSIDGIHKNYRGERVVRGIKEELQEPLMDALGKAFVAKTVADLRRYLQEAVDAVDLLPTDGQKEKEAKQRITNFLEKKKEEIEGRKATRTKRLPDSNAKYLYLFPQLTQDEINRLGRYNLVFKGFNAFNDELNYVVTGNKEDIEEFADDEMGYELHEDYLYAPGDFAGDVFKIEEAQLEDAINFFEGELGYITGEMRFAIGDDPEGDEHNHILEQIKIRGWDENLQEIILKLYDNDEDMEKACEDVLELLEDIKGE